MNEEHDKLLKLEITVKQMQKDLDKISKMFYSTLSGIILILLEIALQIILQHI